MNRRWIAGAAEGILVFVVVLCVYLFSGSNDLRHNGDTDLRYQTTQALVDNGRAWIADPLWRDTRVATGRGGHLYAFYAPGQSVFMAPLYVLGKVAAHHLHLPYDTATLYASRSLDLWLGALLALTFFALARSLGYSRAVAAVLTLVFAFATVAWPDAQSALEQTQVDLFLLLATYTVWQFVAGGLRTRSWMAFAGTALGLCVFTRYDALVYAPIVVLYPLALRARKHEWPAAVGDASVYLAALAPWLALVGLWNVWRFGSPFQTGLHEQTLGEPFLQGLTGLLISPGKGLIWYLPLIFLLPFAAREFYRRSPSVSLFFAALVALPIIFYPNILYWHGDPSWGPRYLYASIPYLVLPLGEILQRWSRLGLTLRGAVIGLVTLSLGLNLAAVSVTQWRFWYRLMAVQQQTADASQWTGQPFHWGSQHYHYYWQPQRSPILEQFDDVYQVLRLQVLGDRRYLLTAKPDPYIATNPADNYSLNTLAFWWADSRHPLFGQRTRIALAAILGFIALASLVGLIARLRAPPRVRGRRLLELDGVALGRAGS
ncbi:MAG TPA: phospholipid carrier-dependent glycosyltransferase [Chloroflexota bacterium]